MNKIPSPIAIAAKIVFKTIGLLRLLKKGASRAPNTHPNPVNAAISHGIPFKKNWCNNVRKIELTLNNTTPNPMHAVTFTPYASMSNAATTSPSPMAIHPVINPPTTDVMNNGFVALSGISARVPLFAVLRDSTIVSTPSRIDTGPNNTFTSSALGWITNEPTALPSSSPGTVIFSARTGTTFFCIHPMAPLVIPNDWLAKATFKAIKAGR